MDRCILLEIFNGKFNFWILCSLLVLPTLIFLNLLYIFLFSSVCSSPTLWLAIWFTGLFLLLSSKLMFFGRWWLCPLRQSGQLDRPDSFCMCFSYRLISNLLFGPTCRSSCLSGILPSVARSCSVVFLPPVLNPSYGQILHQLIFDLSSFSSFPLVEGSSSLHSFLLSGFYVGARLWSKGRLGFLFLCGQGTSPLRSECGFDRFGVSVLVVVCCRWSPVLFLSHRIKRLEDSWFKSHSHGGFPNTSTRCSVKCLWGYKSIFDLIFIVSLARVLANTVSFFRYSS
jgi:hypothetical protein